ncbi:thioredoxin family protein [Candidatus Aenigmatarchaeota archaeon]
MQITIIGSGCPKCEALYNKVKKLKEEGKIDAKIEYKKDVAELVKRGIMGSPAILIDGKPVYVGMPSDEELLKIIKEKEK